MFDNWTKEEMLGWLKFYRKEYYKVLFEYDMLRYRYGEIDYLKLNRIQLPRLFEKPAFVDHKEWQEWLSKKPTV